MSERPQLIADVHDALRYLNDGTLSGRDQFARLAPGLIRPLLSHVEELERELAALRKENAVPRFDSDAGERPDGCQCHNVRFPPCSFCTTDTLGGGQA